MGRGDAALSLALRPARAIAGRAFADARIRTTSFAALFAVVAYIQPVAYRRAYPRLSDRVGFARSFGSNKAIRLFYGEPHNLLTVGGYTAWRVGGTLAIFAAVWGLLAAVRALRAEEDAGRAELIFSGAVGRRSGFLAALAAIAAGACALWVATFVGLVGAGLPAAGSAVLASAATSVVPVFVGIGALACQVAPTRRVATELGAGLLGLLFAVRVVADTSSGLGWLRWATPLGWAEEIRPFADARLLVLLLPGAVTVLLLAAAMTISLSRDLGSGMLPVRDSGAPRLRLLSSPTGQALRTEQGSLLVWVCAVGAFAYIIGVISKSISAAGIPRSLQRELEKLGSGSILTPTGYLGFTFLFFVLAVSLFGVSQVAAARSEEAGEQLETLLALPVARARWLGGRLLLAAAGVAAVSLTAGVLAWAGAASAGARVSLVGMVEAGANCVPVALLFVGVAAFSYAVVPRASAGAAYGLVGVAFLWQLFGALLGAPHWLVEASPFEHVALLPEQHFRSGAAAVMLAVAALGAVAALVAFRERDLLGA
jgi:ABC-2 type transport system permease protein